MKNTRMERSSHRNFEKAGVNQSAPRKQAMEGNLDLPGYHTEPASQSSIDNSSTIAIQRMQIESAFGEAIQRQALEEEEEEPLQGKFTVLQRQPLEEEEEEPLQGKFATGTVPVLQEKPRPNRTGMPDELKAGVEDLSGLSLDDVRVHFNSSQPAAVQAHAYTQGTDIHLAPGQERHLPHEAWHVVQQAQGRVQPTTEIAGIPVNDSSSLEKEADSMGSQALQTRKRK